MPELVSRRNRIIDLVSLVLVVIGVILYIWAYAQMDALRNATHDPKATIFANYTRFVRLMQLSYAGIGAVVIGILVGVGAAINARRAGAGSED